MGFFGGVADNDQKLNFIVFIGFPKNSIFRGHRIGLDLTNFNISFLILRLNRPRTT